MNISNLDRDSLLSLLMAALAKYLTIFDEVLANMPPALPVPASQALTPSQTPVSQASTPAPSQASLPAIPDHPQSPDASPAHPAPADDDNMELHLIPNESSSSSSSDDGFTVAGNKRKKKAASKKARPAKSTVAPASTRPPPLASPHPAVPIVTAKKVKAPPPLFLRETYISANVEPTDSANVPPLCWRLGRVSRLYIGSDQIPRVADIATANGTIKRALNRLVLLPTSDSNES
ncbi:Tel1 [Operophtera brumata]|uniref:Tel1 n=1 Tax=Operophtera brumata TaxID=104452 RepID=A0A0L7L3G7_OPEBR|nr:Tel1 [Operophtera brumata]